MKAAFLMSLIALNCAIPAHAHTLTNWVCVVENTTDKNVFIGYGPSERGASDQATASCRNSGANDCSYWPECGLQSGNHFAWHCRAHNAKTNSAFDGDGSSRIEAGYEARKQCFLQSGSASAECALIYPVDCQLR